MQPLYIMQLTSLLLSLLVFRYEFNHDPNINIKNELHSLIITKRHGVNKKLMNTDMFTFDGEPDEQTNIYNPHQSAQQQQQQNHGHLHHGHVHRGQCQVCSFNYNHNHNHNHGHNHKQCQHVPNKVSLVSQQKNNQNYIDGNVANQFDAIFGNKFKKQNPVKQHSVSIFAQSNNNTSSKNTSSLSFLAPSSLPPFRSTTNKSHHQKQKTIAMPSIWTFSTPTAATTATAAATATATAATAGINGNSSTTSDSSTSRSNSSVSNGTGSSTSGTGTGSMSSAPTVTVLKPTQIPNYIPSQVPTVNTTIPQRYTTNTTNTMGMESISSFHSIKSVHSNNINNTTYSNINNTNNINTNTNTIPRPHLRRSPAIRANLAHLQNATANPNFANFRLAGSRNNGNNAVVKGNGGNGNGKGNGDGRDLVVILRLN